MTKQFSFSLSGSIILYVVYRLLCWFLWLEHMDREPGRYNGVTCRIESGIGCRMLDRVQIVGRVTRHG